VPRCAAACPASHHVQAVPVQLGSCVVSKAARKSTVFGLGSGMTAPALHTQPHAQRRCSLSAQYATIEPMPPGSGQTRDMQMRRAWKQ
jgi:hypothetical protein